MIITPDCEGIVSQMKESVPAGQQLQVLQQYSPVLYSFASCMTADDCCLLAPIINAMLKPYQYLRQIQTHNITDQDQASPLDVFPALPPLNSRGVYTADLKKAELKRCEKSVTRHTTLSPGIFTMFCRHGK